MKLFFENSKLRNPQGTNRIYAAHGMSIYYRHFGTGRIERITMASRIDYSVPLLAKQVE